MSKSYNIEDWKCNPEEGRLYKLWRGCRAVSFYSFDEENLILYPDEFIKPEDLFIFIQKVRKDYQDHGFRRAYFLQIIFNNKIVYIDAVYGNYFVECDTNHDFKQI